MIKIGRIVLGMVGTNCYFVYRDDEEGDKKHALVFDPADNGEHLYNKLKDAGFEVSAIFLTHGHFDHILGVKKLKELSGASVYANVAEKEVLTDVNKNCTNQIGKPYDVDADVYLKDGEEITLASITLKMIATPGHTIGSCCYYIEEMGTLVCGDTLFEQSVGRTDLPTGSESTLIRSIRGKLFVLPEETQCYPGHGDSTTIGYEKKYNPFCC